jgi:hypothetical protein
MNPSVKGEKKKCQVFEDTGINILVGKNWQNYCLAAHNKK